MRRVSLYSTFCLWKYSQVFFESYLEFPQPISPVSVRLLEPTQLQTRSQHVGAIYIYADLECCCQKMSELKSVC